MMQAWLGDGTAGAAARILAALRAGEAARIESELARAAEICRAPRRDSCAAERTEVLDAVVQDLLRAAGRPGGDGDVRRALLAHLAGL
jgi:hypothetical protein